MWDLMDTSTKKLRINNPTNIEPFKRQNKNFETLKFKI